MKKTLLLLIVLAASAWSQTAPNAYTTNYRIRQWASGANPSADSLNANWALIDSSIRTPYYINVDTIRARGTMLRLGSGDGSDTVFVNASASAYSAAWDLYVNGLTASTAGIYVGVPSTTAGGIRIYTTDNAFYGQLVRAGSFSGNVSLQIPALAAGTYTIATTDGAQTFTSLTTTGSLDGDGDLADTSAFSGTATRLAIYISGATSTDKYAVSPRIVAAEGGETLPGANDILGAAAKTDSLIVVRPASGTSGLKISYIRVK